MQGKSKKTGADAVAEVTPRRPASTRSRVEPSGKNASGVSEAQSRKPEKSVRWPFPGPGIPDIPTGIDNSLTT
jgi:hypothetical protein